MKPQKKMIEKPRARDLGIPFDGSPGLLNAITDVQGIEIGHSTIVSGNGKLVVGKGPVRTGVTAVFPRGKKSADPVFVGWYTLNGNGEMTGTTWIEESGFLEGPIMLTNTHSVGTVRDSVIEWQIKHHMGSELWSLPAVAETYDGFLNDINGFHIKKKHVFAALDNANSGPVAEGNVGGGTGMTCFEFKGGIGTASRKVKIHKENYAVGVLVQTNFGRRQQLRIAGAPVGAEIPDHTIKNKGSSIIIVVATDAPLLPHQLKRVARRASLGLGRVGSIASNFSGDIFISFSTMNLKATRSSGIFEVTMLSNNDMDPLFEATVQATEEAIINALIAAETMTGRDGNKAIAIPHDRLKQVLRKYNRLAETNNSR